MRLPMLDGGHFSWRARITMQVMKLATGLPAPDVVKLHFFNHEKVGAKMGAAFQAAMRGPSDWSVSDRETMAAFVSKLNQCVF
jgi:hypothetical protein